MPGAEIRDRDEIERWLRRDARAHVYALADLDDVFWSDTRWFAARRGGELAAVCLVLEKLALPILYAISPAADPAMSDLLVWLRGALPERVFATLGLGLSASLADDYRIDSHGEFVKMALDGAPARLDVAEPAGLERLRVEHCDELRDFYAHDAYTPEERHGRFFESYMLELGPWFGVREAGRLISVAGVHVVSSRTSVAALGGIATRPDRRGRGLARATTAVLCRALRQQVDLIGLNVAAANTSARRCYDALGFREVCRYEEMELSRRAKA